MSKERDVLNEKRKEEKRIEKRNTLLKIGGAVLSVAATVVISVLGGRNDNNGKI